MVERSKKQKNDKITQVMGVIIWVIIFLYSLTILALYFWVLMTSFKGRMDWITDKFGFPATLTFENYSNAFSKFFVLIFPSSGGQSNIYTLELLFNTVLYMVGCSVMATMTPCIVAYAAAKFKFGFNKVLDSIVLITMILPIIGSLQSEITITKSFGFYGSFLGMFFMKTSFLGMNYFLFKSAFKGVSYDYTEAAKVDGASNFRIMTQIMLPMVANIIWLIMLLQLIGYWGDWKTPMIYLPYNPTLAYALFNMQFSNDYIVSFKPVQLAACILASLPTLLLFISFRKLIMGGMAFGGIKG